MEESYADKFHRELKQALGQDQGEFVASDPFIAAKVADLEKEAFTGILDDIRHPLAEPLPPAATQRSSPNTCPTCGRGMTRAYVGPNSDETHMICTNCRFKAKSSSANYRSLIEYKNGKAIRLGYWPITSARADAKLTKRLLAEYNDPKRFELRASVEIPPVEEIKEASSVTNIMDAQDEQREVIGTVKNIRPSKHSEGYDIVTLETPAGLTSTTRLPSGQYSIGDIIRGERVPLSELPAPESGPRLVKKEEPKPKATVIDMPKHEATIASVKTAGPGLDAPHQGPRDIAVQNGDAHQPQMKKQPEGYSWEWNGNEVTLCGPVGCIILEGDEAREFTADMANFDETAMNDDVLEQKIDKLIRGWFELKSMNQGN